MRKVSFAVNICTYHRQNWVKRNIDILLSSLFFSDKNSRFFGCMHIFVVDNASEITLKSNEFLHLIYNCNSGGAGGFQKGLENIRSFPVEFTHVIFMDDDVNFEIDSFYTLYDFLQNVEEEYVDHPVAGRMFCMDQPDIQYTAAEVWNKGNLKHIEYMRKVSSENYIPGRVTYDAGADYGGWWFCCFPMTFAKSNDILPFFIHCDDVEYGLRCGKKPIIIEGVQVWHETFEKRITSIIRYYDTRNPLFVNEIYHLNDNPKEMLSEWKRKISTFHLQEDWLTEYYLILALNDFLKGLKWLKSINPEKYHKKLLKKKSNRIKNALFWRLVDYRARKKYHL